MQTLPPPVLNYLLKTIFADRSPAYLCVSQEGYLNHWGGQLSQYGIGDLQTDKPIGIQIAFLEGLLPLEGTELFLPHLKTNEGRCADIYLFPDQTCDWVLLLDATADELQCQLLQQYRNHLSLLQDQHTQLINRSLQSSSPPSPVQFTPLSGGDRKKLTILFANLRGFLPFSEQNPADSVFKVLNLYLRTLIQAIVSEAGMVDQLLGEAVMACFGVLPSLANAPTDATQAGLKILAAVREVNHLRQLQQQPTFDVGIGIASGSTAIGVLSNHRYHKLGAIGRAVHLATALQRQANPGEILIDENTFNQATLMQQHFTRVDRSIPHLTEAIEPESIKVYSTNGGSGDG